MGHQIVFLIGDFTGRFGYPSDKLTARKMRPKKEVKALAKNYIKQVGKILDLNKTEIRYNSEWYDKMSAEELLKLMSTFTVAGMLERDMFQKRIKENKEIRFHEPVYPLLQGYDSVMLKADLTVCGTDQLFNELKGRDLQVEFGQEPQSIITTELLIGTDGKEKMSQSLGNYIGIAEKAKDQYGKIMSIPDNLIIDYFKGVTEVPLDKIKEYEKQLEKTNPKEIKEILAKEVVSFFHGEKKAENSAEEFKKVFKNKQVPTDIKEVKIKEKTLPLLDLLNKTKLVSSKSEAKRLVQQGAVKINNRVFPDWKKEIEIKDNIIIQVGKRRFIKIKT